MKKLLVQVLLALFSLTTAIQPQSVAVQTRQHQKKDGTPDKRYKENKKPKGPLTKGGKPDMRYKSNNPNAGKKKPK